MKKTIYLVRHAHIETKRQMIGSLDLALSQKGIMQAKDLRKNIVSMLTKDIKFREDTKNISFCFQNIYVSPLLRTRQTANILLTDSMNMSSSYTIEPNFQEIYLGDWEGLQKQEIMEKYPYLWQKRGENLAHTAPPNGESFSCLQKRVLPCFQKKVESMQGNLPVLIVAHQAVNRIILGYLQGLDLQDILTIDQDYGCVSRIEMYIKKSAMNKSEMNKNDINTVKIQYIAFKNKSEL